VFYTVTSVNLTPRFSAIPEASVRKTDAFKGKELAMAGKTERELRAANINGGEKGWAIINANGPFGDDVIAGYMTERDARVCLAALGGFSGADDWRMISTDGGVLAYSAELNLYQPVHRVRGVADGPE
jgi:hypothetical protein